MAADPPHGLSPSVVARISAVFAAHPSVEKAILYGSRAKGSQKESSDIDLALVGSGLEESELLRIDAELDDLLLPYQIDLCLLEAIENPDLRDHIARVGKVFYSRG